MTTITVPRDIFQSVVTALELVGVRNPTEYASGLSGNSGFLTWTPDLSPTEQATVASIVKLAIGSTLLSPAERTALEPDFNTLRLYQNAATPTLAQTATAVKSIIDVLRAFVRD